MAQGNNPQLWQKLLDELDEALLVLSLELNAFLLTESLQLGHFVFGQVLKVQIDLLINKVSIESSLRKRD